MGLYNRMSRVDKRLFQQMGIIKPPAKSHNLIYTYCGKEEIILESKAYSLCVWKENKLKGEGQYRRGVFSIKPN